MPIISRFYGIVISMYFRDHPPPHFHVRYGERRATVEIVSGLTDGTLPPRARRMVEEWRSRHAGELLQCWERARADGPLPSIAPLE